MSPESLVVFNTVGWIVTIVAALYGMRRQPPLDKELANYRTRPDCTKCRDDIYSRINGDRKDLDDKIMVFQRAMTENFQNVIRAIGQLEGKLRGK